jgi:hypothetical protein
MTRLFLAAGVAALAIAAPASAKPGGGNGGHGGDRGGAAQFHGGGGGGGGGHGNAQARGGGGGGRANVQARGGGGGGRGFEMRGGGRQSFSAPRQQRSFAFQNRERGQARVRVERSRGSDFRMAGRTQHQDRNAFRAERMNRQQARVAERNQMRVNRMEQIRGRERQQARLAERNQMQANRQQMRVDNRLAERQQMRDRVNDRQMRIDNRQAFRDQLRANSDNRVALRNDLRERQFASLRDGDWGSRDRWDRGYSRGLVNGCPPGLWMKNNGCLPPGQERKLLGQSINSFRAASVPFALTSFYPDTNDYYWRYNDGYMYQVDRSSNLVDALLPLIGGGYVPGTMFPSAYSPYYQSGYTFPNYYGNSYFADDYGWNAFYPDTPYMDYRYLNGNVYGVDPYSGMVEDVIPTYAYGYGVGQMLPAGYGYYNVPYQYRNMYYDTSDSNYWYAPGAIYQVDPNSQLITSVASLLSPGLSIGQPLPVGYDVYNVPYDYRQTYFDTPNAWYRYNNGYIYQVDPTTRLVQAVVASLLT